MDCLADADQNGKLVFIFLQSKSKSNDIEQAPNISTVQVTEERQKAFKVPKKLGKATQLYIANAKQESDESVIQTAAGKCVFIGLEQHPEFYSCLAFLKAALLRD